MPLVSNGPNRFSNSNSILSLGSGPVVGDSEVMNFSNEFHLAGRTEEQLQILRLRCAPLSALGEWQKRRICGRWCVVAKPEVTPWKISRICKRPYGARSQHLWTGHEKCIWSSRVRRLPV